MLEEILVNSPVKVGDLITNPWFWAISCIIDFWWLSKVFDWMLGTSREPVSK